MIRILLRGILLIFVPLSFVGGCAVQDYNRYLNNKGIGRYVSWDGDTLFLENLPTTEQYEEKIVEALYNSIVNRAGDEAFGGGNSQEDFTKVRLSFTREEDGQEVDYEGEVIISEYLKFSSTKVTNFYEVTRLFPKHNYHMSISEMIGSVIKQSELTSQEEINGGGIEVISTISKDERVRDETFIPRENFENEEVGLGIPIDSFDDLGEIDIDDGVGFDRDDVEVAGVEYNRYTDSYFIIHRVRTYPYNSIISMEIDNDVIKFK